MTYELREATSDGRLTHKVKTAEEAKQMLETGDLPVEAITNALGHDETSFVGRYGFVKQ